MNANTNINVLGGILDAMLANLTEHIDKRVEAKVFTLTERIVALETNQFREAAISVIKPTDDVILRLDKMREDMDSVMNCQDNDQMENSRRITELENNLAARTVDIEELEKEQSDDLMEQQYRIKMFEKLEAHLSGEQPDTKFDLSLLGSEEFRLAVIKVIDQQVMEDTFLDPLVEAITDSDKFVDAINTVANDAASSAADEALDNHTSDYDHDDIHEMSDHEIDSDAIREVVVECLESATIRI